MFQQSADDAGKTCVCVCVCVCVEVWKCVTERDAGQATVG